MKLESSVTLFDDNKVEDRFAELQVTADGITAEVGRKVGNDEVISRINQSAEAVTIDANKINIDGVITAVNDNTTTTIDGDKITTGTLNGERIIANTINGNRIIANTLSAGAIKADSGQFSTANIPDLNADKITSGDILASRMSANLVSAFQAVVSDLKALAATIGGFFIGDTDIHTKDVPITSNADNSVGLSSSVFTRTINGTSRSNLKFAIGSKFGVDKSGTLYANGANVTSISADNISTGTINTSRLNANEVKSQIVQTAELNAGKITAGTLDTARLNANEIKSQIVQTTELNAGKITAGTLDTARLNANEIKSQIVQTAELNAGKITSGTLSADRIGANSIGAGKIKVDEINIGAAQITSGTIDTARIPNLSATKITTDTLDGARINVMGASNGARAALTSAGLDIYNSSNQKKASYGTNAVIYGGANTYPLVSVTGSSVNFMQSANNYASVDSSGLMIYQDGISVAEFGSSNRIGDYNHKHIQITNTDLNVYDDDGSIPFQVSTATSSTTEPYSIAWYINANSSYVTQAYFKGTIVNNTVSVGVATSGVPTASDTITLTNVGTPYTITVSGVKYTFTRYNGIVTYSIQNTNSAKRSCLVSFTQSYRKTTVKENSHTLDTRYQTVSIEDATGTCNDAILYTYAGVAQLHLRVYRGSSSVSNGGLIYKGVLGGFAPIYDCYMVGQINGIYAVSGYIDSRGNIYIYNTSGGSRTVNSSNMARLSATYLLAQ